MYMTQAQIGAYELRHRRTQSQSAQMVMEPLCKPSRKASVTSPWRGLCL